MGRPKMFYSQRIHDKCYRRPHFDAGQFVEQWDDEGARRATASTRWAARARPPTTPATALERGVSFPIQRPRLHRLLEDGFWDNGSFYDRLTNIHQFGVEATPTRSAAPPPAWSSRRRRGGHAASVQRDQARDVNRPPRGRTGNAMAAYETQGLQARQRRPQPRGRRPGHAASRATCAWRSTSTTRTSSATRCPPAPCGAGWRSSSRAATRATPGPSPSASAACAPAPTRSPAVRAVEDALGIQIPEEREHHPQHHAATNLQVHDHLVHFYHLHALDWVDVVSAR